MAQRREALKSHDESCYINSCLVDVATTIPEPFSEGYYYYWFEYTDCRPGDRSELPAIISEFCSPYFQAQGNYPPHTIGKPECLFGSSQLHIEKCGNCEFTLPDACRTCTRRSGRGSCPSLSKLGCYCSFTRELCFFLPLDPDYACPPDRRSASAPTECIRCRYVAEPSTLPSDNKTITVHDLRLLGHPTVIKIMCRSHRCNRKNSFLQSLPGIHAGSDSKSLRYSIRLAKAVSSALLEKLPQNYISEASGIPYDSVRSWRRREMKRLHELIYPHRVETLLTYDGNFGIQLHEITIGEENYCLCLQGRDGPVVCGLFASKEWDSCSSLFHTNESDPTRFFKSFTNFSTSSYAGFDLLFNIFAMGSPLAPNVGAYIAYRVLLFHLDWGFLPPIDLPQNLSAYLEDCWNLFEDMFLPGKINEEECRSLLHRLYHGPSQYHEEDDDPADAKMRVWYDAVLNKASSYDVILPRPDNDVILADWNLIKELNSTPDVPHEDVPILVQYYNPAILKDGIEKGANPSTPDRYRYLFDCNGDLCLPERTEKQPFIRLEDLYTSLKAGILQESDPDGELLSAKMLRLDPESVSC